jgi:penicillin amidase
MTLPSCRQDRHFRVMHRLLRLLRRLLSIVGTLVLLTLAASIGLIWLALPGGDMQIAIPGLSAPVDITVDADGIPRIRAANATDAAAALGFLHARERLVQMDLMRRAASGELSEIAGPATLRNDRLMRVLGLRARAVADLPTLDPEVHSLLEAYARGVNAWIDRRGRFAAEAYIVLGAPRHWSVVDSLLWGKTMGLYLSGNWRTELARQALADRLDMAAIDELWPDHSGQGHPEARLDPTPAATAAKLAHLLPSFPDRFTLPASASNEWAVDGQHSASGAPLLAGDPHLGFSLPGPWYLARIDTPQGVLAGATAPGVPLLVLGHNDYIAWTFTTTGAAVQDLFVETPVGNGEYMTPDGPRPFELTEERIDVRGATSERLLVRRTRHGPVISDLVAPNGPVLALAMANLADGDTAPAGLLALNRAEDVEAAGRAAATITAPVQNLLVADRSRIALYVTGRVPVRRAGNGAIPSPGADGSHDWVGWASGEQLPHVVAPESGRLVNANERVAPPDFPVSLGRDWFGDWRARRIRELLGNSDHHSAADFAAMQTDAISVAARDLLPGLTAIGVPEEPARSALALLRGWDGTMAVDLPQPLIFNAWMQQFRDALLTRIGVSPAEAAAVAPWPELVTYALSAEGAHWCGGDCRPMLADTLAASSAALAQRFGDHPASWRWGLAHQAVFADPSLQAIPLLGRLAEASIAAPGDDTTVDRGGLRDDTFEAVHGASFRAVYDLADLDQSLFIVAPGQSGHPASRLARNFVRRWRDGGIIMLGVEPQGPVVHLRLTAKEPPA